MSIRLIPPQSELTLPYWNAAARHELVMQRCSACSSWQFPPRSRCAECGAAGLVWEQVSGRGEVYTFTIAHRPPHAVLAALCPLVVAVIQLDEGPRMMSNIVACEPSSVGIGMKVAVSFDTIDGSDVVLPVFVPAPTV